MKPTLSVIVPALNEEAHIAATVAEVTAAIGHRFADHELLLFDDGSRDRTGAIMDQLAAHNPRIRVTHNRMPHNLGGVYKQGLALARYDYVILVPGDNENPAAALTPIFDAVGQADVVVPHPRNLGVRPPARRLLSRGYTAMMNLISGHRLAYYNGTCLCRTASVRAITIHTDSFAYASEVLLKLLQNGARYTEVGIDIQPRPGRTTKAFRLKNILTVLGAVARVALELRTRRPPAVTPRKP